MSPELVEAVRELKEAIITALSVSKRQVTVVPIYIPISVAQMIPQTPLQASNHAIIARALTQTPGEVICPKCGRPGKLYEMRRGGRTYILVLHGRQKCYLGPVDEVKVNWPSLAERGLLNNAQHEQARVPLPSGSQAEECGLSVAQNLNLPQIALPQVRGFPSQVKGAGLRSPWRRPAWVQIPPPAPIPIGKHI